MFDPSPVVSTVSQLNQKGYVHAILDHPLGAVIEYPQSIHSPGLAVAHWFTVDPVNCLNPHNNIVRGWFLLTQLTTSP